MEQSGTNVWLVFEIDQHSRLRRSWVFTTATRARDFRDRLIAQHRDRRQQTDVFMSPRKLDDCEDVPAR